MEVRMESGDEIYYASRLSADKAAVFNENSSQVELVPQRHEDASMNPNFDVRAHDDTTDGDFRNIELIQLGRPNDSLLPTADNGRVFYKARWTERWSQWANDRWLFELVASSISAACLGGIVITLMIHANGPLPQWPLAITINALVSTLSTISRSALLVSVAAVISQRKWLRLSRGNHPLSDLETFDEASRGPWGSLSLLWSIGLSDMVALGAIITVLSLSMDPFMQQITTFESVPQSVGKTKTWARAIFEMGVDQTGDTFPDLWARLQGNFSPLVYQGFYFDGNLTEISRRNALQLHPLSSGGNVTFDVAETLAVCSECANITHLLPPPTRSTEDSEEWEWTLPNGFSTGWTRFGDRSTMVITSTIDADPLQLDNSDRLVIFNVTTIVPSWVLIDGHATEGEGRPGAAQECTLYWCVNKYETRLTGSLLEETLISSFGKGAPEPGTPFFSIKPPGSNMSLPWPNSNMYGNYSKGWINGTFLVNNVSNYWLRDWFGNLLNGYTVSLNYYRPGASVFLPGYAFQSRLYSRVWFDGPDNSTRLDFHDIFEAMALGMTTVVRSPDTTHHGEDALLDISGTEMANAVIVRVNWAWITLPIVLQVAALVFMSETLMVSGRQKLQAWKSSALAVLFFGMDIANKVEHGINVQSRIDMLRVTGRHRREIRVKNL